MQACGKLTFNHVARNQPLRSELRKGAKSAVPLADRAIGNLQQWLIGTYHGVSKAQLQVYLDELPALVSRPLPRRCCATPTRRCRLTPPMQVRLLQIPPRPPYPPR